MLDFRYHALSLVAVLVALVVGLLLGIAIGDQGLVSSAERSLREDLRSDVQDAQAESAALSEQLERRRRYEELTLPGLIDDRLAGRRVNVLFLDERSEAIFDQVGEAVEAADGELGLVATLDTPLDRSALAEAVGGTQYEDLDEDPARLEALGRRLGTQLVRGGRLLEQLRGPLLTASSGSSGQASALVVARAPVDPPDGEDAEAVEAGSALIEAILEGAATAGAALAGVEETTTDPSQVPWYRQHDMPSVDNLDEVPGLASLAVVLAGEADGAYGVKSTSDAYVPDALIRRP